MRIFTSIFLLFFLLKPIINNAQEINFEISVNSDLINQTNQQIFNTLERSIKEFVNGKEWIGQQRTNEERLDCSMVLNITGYNNSAFEGTLQIQVQRSVYKTSFKTPIFNYLDKDITFTYQEFQPLFYNASAYESNLVSLLSFYIFISLGMEADTFQEKGGNPYFSTAQQILNLAKQSQIKGWGQADGNRNRYWLVETILSNTFREFKSLMYEYHRKGLDLMVEDTLEAKQNIMKSLQNLIPLYNRRPNAFLIQIFFDAKSDEIVDVFSDGPKMDFDSTKNLLDKVAPFFSTKWRSIKY